MSHHHDTRALRQADLRHHIFRTAKQNNICFTEAFATRDTCARIDNRRVPAQVFGQIDDRQHVRAGAEITRRTRG